MRPCWNECRAMTPTPISRENAATQMSSLTFSFFIGAVPSRAGKVLSRGSNRSPERQIRARSVSDGLLGRPVAHAPGADLVHRALIERASEARKASADATVARRLDARATIASVGLVDGQVLDGQDVRAAFPPSGKAEERQADA